MQSEAVNHERERLLRDLKAAGLTPENADALAVRIYRLAYAVCQQMLSEERRFSGTKGPQP
jgi:hypothetical protein